jgi:hypothetical protein
MDLPKRFGIKKLPALALVPPEYLYPENSIEAVVWDGEGEWRDWFNTEIKKMTVPVKSKKWSDGAIIRRDSCEHGEATRCNKFPNQLPRYTEDGYRKITMPDEIYDRLMGFYGRQEKTRFTEKWPMDACQTNFHEKPMTMVYLDNEARERDAIGRLVEPLLAKWTGTHDLELTSFYGIREYHRGNELHMHIDRIESHAISAILNIAQEGMDEDWLLEVIDQHGVWKTVPMKAKEMILYESSTVIHGRPKTLKGAKFVNAFVHFRPRDWRFFSSDDRVVNKGDRGDYSESKAIVFENKASIAVDIWQWESAENAAKLTQMPLQPGGTKAFNFRYGAQVIWTLPGIRRAILADSHVDRESSGHRLLDGHKPGTYLEETFGKLTKAEKAVMKEAENLLEMKKRRYSFAYL